MKWENPIVLIFLPVLFFIGLGLFYRALKRIFDFKYMVKVEGIVKYSSTKIILKLILLFLGLIVLIISAAGPRWGIIYEGEVQKPAGDVIIATDISSSMRAEDIAPSRIDAAQKKINFIIQELAQCRIGLIFFAGSAFNHCPVTFDLNAVESFVEDAWDDMVLLPGTNIEEALNLAIESFPTSKHVVQRYIVLITDGEELQGDYKKRIKQLNRENIKVITYGIGTSEGARIPFYENGKITSYKRGPSGDIVVSKLDEELLENLAEKTGGEYIGYSKKLDDITEIAGAVNIQTVDDIKRDSLQNLKLRYQLPLFLALLVLLIDFMVGTRGKLI